MVAGSGAACTSDGGSPGPNGAGGAQTTAPSDNSKPGLAPQPSVRCNQSGNEPVAKVVVSTSDGVKLSGARFGSGPRGVVLLPQKGADFCAWWPFATELLRRGFQVLAIDMRRTGYSEDGTTLDYTADAVAAVASLHDSGATKVVLVGASQGANTALVTAGRIPDKITAVVALSFTDNGFDATGGAGGPGPRTPAEAAPLTTSAMMLCFTAGDPEVAKAKPQALYDAAGTKDRQLVGRAGVSHGWDMLKVGGDNVSDDVIAFIDAHA
jgi:pimeloyl-ACP methyl ester carboxylesterase